MGVIGTERFQTHMLRSDINMDDLPLLKRDLLFEIQRCVELYNSKVFCQLSIFTQSAFIEILIRLNDVLQKLKNHGNKINWTDDVNVDQKIKDIADLVNSLRNAACHIDSPENYVKNSNIKFVFNTFVGRCSNTVKIGENISLGNKYQDDTAFYYGDKRIYLVRHIKRLLEELPDEINKLHVKTF